MQTNAISGRAIIPVFVSAVRSAVSTLFNSAIRRLASVSDRTWFSVMAASTFGVLVFAGRYSATMAKGDAAGLSLTAIVALLSVMASCRN